MTLTTCFLLCSGCSSQKNLSVPSSEKIPSFVQLESAKQEENETLKVDENSFPEIDLIEVVDLVKEKMKESLSPEQWKSIQTDNINDFLSLRDFTHDSEHRYCLVMLSDYVFGDIILMLYDRQNDSLEMLPECPFNYSFRIEGFDCIFPDSNSISISCSGQRVGRETIFPYQLIYDIKEKNWELHQQSLKSIPTPYRVGNEIQSNPSYQLTELSIEQNTLKVVLHSPEYLESSFPNCVFSYQDNVYQFWFEHLENPEQTFSLDTKNLGIQEWKLKPYQLENHSGVLLELTVSKDYNVFCTLEQNIQNSGNNYDSYYSFNIRTKSLLP